MQPDSVIIVRIVITELRTGFATGITFTAPEGTRSKCTTTIPHGTCCRQRYVRILLKVSDLKV